MQLVILQSKRDRDPSIIKKNTQQQQQTNTFTSQVYVYNYSYLQSYTPHNAFFSTI